MATALQIEANRRNAAGPHQMSEKGKEAVRQNAVRHGLASKLHIVLPGEDQNVFDELVESLQAEYAPATTLEEVLVTQIAENYWKLLRAHAMESGCFEIGAKSLSQSEPDVLSSGAKLALAMAEQEKVFGNVRRYQAAAERAYYRAIRELHKLQSIGPASAPPEEIGSDLQSPEKPANPEEQIGGYSIEEIQKASLTMPEDEFFALMDRITAPPIE